MRIHVPCAFQDPRPLSHLLLPNIVTESHTQRALPAARGEAAATHLGAVEEAEMKVGAQIQLVNVGIAGQHIKSLQHRGMITRENLEAEISQEDIEEFAAWWMSLDVVNVQNGYLGVTTTL